MVLSDLSKVQNLKQSSIVILISLVGFLLCRPADLNNIADIRSTAFRENVLLQCALGLCNFCNPPGPWGSFVGEVTTSGSQTDGFKLASSASFDLFGFAQTTNDFGLGGIGYQGTVGSTTNYLISKFSAAGSPIWQLYAGQRSDSPTGLVFRDGDGLYFFASTQTSTLPNPLVNYANTGTNSILGKISDSGTILWSRYYNNGLSANTVNLVDVINRLDNSGLLAFGYTNTVGGVASGGTILGTRTTQDWFVQTLTYDGIAISTRYINMPAPILSIRSTRIAEIPGGFGYYVLAFTSVSIEPSFPNNRNSFPGVLSTLLMKFDAGWNYQWHTYLGNPGVAVLDDIQPFLSTTSDQSVLVSSLYDQPIPTTGSITHPGSGLQSTLLWRLDGSGNIEGNSFLNSSSGAVLFSGKSIANGNVLAAGFADGKGFSSEILRNPISESIRLVGEEEFRGDAVEHCDGFYSSFGSAFADLSTSPIRYGNGNSNAYFSRFRR